ncbi:MAG: UDP-2,3-diacylglucosamine diphosphatase LpxI [Alphaproteobacteria bacterium]|jgi:hypothetical protein|nr:UDP-2,3-diacylglucosamine diphosphatase LpxI [Alphaproteobacteria bacterium]
MSPTYGIISGNGALPRLLAEHCRAASIPYYLHHLGEPAPWLSEQQHPHALGRIGAVAATLDAFRAHGVTHVIFAGGLKRPPLTSLAPDAVGAKLLARLGFSQLRPNGDDSLLRTVAAFLEEQGFQVTGAHELLGGALIPPRCLSKRQPTDAENTYIRLGFAALHQLGGLDLGQAVVVAEGRLLAVEGVEGTDALLARCGGYSFNGAKILVKAPKPQQDQRLDLPALGVDTLHQAAAHGFAGVAALAGQTLLFERDAAVSAADAAGLFLIGVPAP